SPSGRTWGTRCSTCRSLFTFASLTRRAPMGWWRIDPDTGMPQQDSRSKLSTPDWVLLNAVPGVDDEQEAYYLGDFPCDCAADMADELAAFLRRHRLLCPTLEELMALVLDGVVPPSFSPVGKRPVKELLTSQDELWAAIDGAYQEDWGRPARRRERAAACREYLERLTKPGS